MPHNNELPNWLADATDYTDDTYPCPYCAYLLTYSGPLAPGLHFECKHCEEQVQFRVTSTRQVQVRRRACSLCGAEMVKRRGKYGEFWGCSEYTRANPCKGKPIVMSVSVTVHDYVLVEFDAHVAVWCDPVKRKKLDDWKRRPLRLRSGTRESFGGLDTAARIWYNE